eukprot:Colp12_sorted_trinity150504_noHs@36220
MAAKTKAQIQQEADLEKHRLEEQWDSLAEAIERYSKNNAEPLLEASLRAELCLHQFLNAKAKGDTNITEAVNKAHEAIEKAQGLAGGNSKELNLYSGILAFETGKVADGIRIFEEATPSTEEKKESSRVIKYQIAGAMYRAKSAEESGDTEKEVSCLTIAFSLLNTYADGSSNFIKSHLAPSISRLPQLLIKQGKLSAALDFWRGLYINANPNVDQSVVSRDFAKALLLQCTDTVYSSGIIAEAKRKSKTADMLFMPSNRLEEALLLLTTREQRIYTVTGLSVKNPDEVARRTHLVNSLYDDVVVAAVCAKMPKLLVDVTNKSMKFSFENSHLWIQHALALVSSGKYWRAILVLEQWLQECEPDVSVLLTLGKVLLHPEVEDLERAEAVAVKAVEMKDELLAPRALELLGIVKSRRALKTHDRSTRETQQQAALEALHQALELDDQCPSIAYNLALHYAYMQRPDKALPLVEYSLRLDRRRVESLQLLALLHTAQHDVTKALAVIDSAVAMFPDNWNLLFMKAQLQTEAGQHQAALNTYQWLLDMWRRTFGSATKLEEHRQSNVISPITLMNKERFVVPAVFTEDAASAVGSEVTTATSVHKLKQVYTADYELTYRLSFQLAIWLGCASAFTRSKRESDALACLNEARALFPFSAAVHYQTGRFHEAREQYHKAVESYELALSINPNHVKSYVRLGAALITLKSYHVAEKWLHDATVLDPTNHEAWFYLGTALRNQKLPEKACDCFQLAMDLEDRAPLVPYHMI